MIGPDILPLRSFEEFSRNSPVNLSVEDLYRFFSFSITLVDAVYHDRRYLIPEGLSILAKTIPVLRINEIDCANVLEP
jgi:hypothetical protein